jgi:hypothetical protein
MAAIARTPITTQRLMIIFVLLEVVLAGSGVEDGTEVLIPGTAAADVDEKGVEDVVAEDCSVVIDRDEDRVPDPATDVDNDVVELVELLGGSEATTCLSYINRPCPASQHVALFFPQQ